MLTAQETEVLNSALARWRSAVQKLEQKNAGAARTSYREVAQYTPPFGERLGAIVENEPARKLLATLLAKSEPERDVANFLTLALCDAAVLVTESDAIAGLTRVLGIPDTAFTNPDAQAQLKATLGAQTAFPFMSVRGTRSLPTLAPMFPVDPGVLVEICRQLSPQLSRLGGSGSPTAFEDAAREALIQREETAPEQKSVAVGHALRQLYALHRHVQAIPGRDLDAALRSFAQQKGWQPDRSLPFPIAEVWDELCGLPGSRPPSPRAKPVAPPEPEPEPEPPLEDTVSTTIETMTPAQLIVEIFRGRIAKLPDGSDARVHAKLPANALPWGLYRTNDNTNVLVSDTEAGLTPAAIVELLNSPYPLDPGAALVHVDDRDWVVASWPFDLDLKLPSMALQGLGTQGPIRRWVRPVDPGKHPPFTLARRDASIERVVRLTEQGATWVDGQLPAASSPRIQWRLLEADGGLRPALLVQIPPEAGATEARVVIGDAIEETVEAWAHRETQPLVDVAPDARITAYLDGRPTELKATLATPALFAPMGAGKAYRKTSWKDLLTRRGPLVMVVDERADVTASDAMLEPVALKGAGWERFRAMRLRPQIGQIADIRVGGKKMIDFPPPAMVRLGVEGGTGGDDTVLLHGEPAVITVSGFLGDHMKDWSSDGRLVIECEGQRSEERIHAPDDIFTFSLPVSQLHERLGLMRKPAVVRVSLKDVRGVAPRGPERIALVPAPRIEIVSASVTEADEFKIALSVKIGGGVSGVPIEVGDPVEKRWRSLVAAPDGIASLVIGRPADRTLPTRLVLPLRVRGVSVPGGLAVPLGDEHATAGALVREPSIDDTIRGVPPPAELATSALGSNREAIAGPYPQTIREVRPMNPAASSPAVPPPPADPHGQAAALLDRHERAIADLTAALDALRAFSPAPEAELIASLSEANTALDELDHLLRACGGDGLAGVKERADVGRRIDDAVKARETRRRSAHLEHIARELETGTVEHRLKKRQDQLEQLRAAALAQVTAATSASEPPDLPAAPDGAEWLVWIWSLVDPMLSDTLDQIRGSAPALAQFLEEVEPAFWRTGR